MHPHVTLSPRRLAVTLLGTLLAGGAGSLVRYGLTSLDRLPSDTRATTTWIQLIPWWLLAINALGAGVAAFALWGPLRRHDPNDLARVLVVTGFLGGLTSYSTLFQDLGNLWHVSTGGGLLVSAAALLSGFVFAASGIRLARRWSHARGHP